MARVSSYGKAFRVWRFCSLALAVSALLFAVVLPHHHHAGRACVAVETCLLDYNANDSHTGHDDDGSSCIEKEFFVAAKQRSAQANVVILTLALPAEPVAAPPAVSSRAPSRCALGATYVKMACASRVGLRAPPACV